MRIRFNSLKARLIIALLLIVILPTITISWVALNIMSEHTKSDRISNVGQVADAKHEQLVMVLTRANSRAKLFFPSLIKRCGGNTAKFNHICATHLIDAYLAAEGAIGANLHRKGDGVSLTIGTSAVQNEENPAFQTGQLAKFSSTGANSNHSYFVSVAEESSGLQLSITYPASVLEPVFNPPPAVLGLSGETFLADGGGYFVTRPRYASTQGHDLPISAHPMQSCLSGQNREVLDLDYRGAAIVHGFRFIPEFGSACIMAHISQDEAFAPLKLLKRQLIFAIILFCATLIIAIIYLARSIVKPITELTKVTRAIAAGDCQAQAEVAGSDETSELAISFNSMTKRLVQSEKMLNEAQQLAHLGGWERDFATGSLACSEEIFRIFEIDPAHTGISYEEFMLTVHPEDREMVDQAYLTCIQTRKPFNIVHRLLLADGRVKWVNEHGTFYYDASGVPLRSIGTIQDITERKQADDMLRVAATTFETHEGIVITDAHANIIRVNQAFQDITGYSQEEVLGKNPRIRSSGRQDKAFYAAMWQQLLNNGSWTGEIWNKHKDGQIYPEWLTITAVKNEQGEATEYVAIFSDITERKRTEDARARFAAILEQTTDFVAMAEPVTGHLTYMNSTGRALLEIGESEEIGKMVFSDTHPEWANELVRSEGLPVAIAHGTWSGETALLSRSGREIPVLQVIMVHRGQDGEIVYYSTVMRDISNRKDAEDELCKYVEELRTINQQLHDTQNLLLQSDKMASVGQLAAGVAHEINNPIGYVGSNLGSLDGYLKELFGLVAAYEEMESAVADDAALARVKAVKNKVDLGFLKEDALSLMRESQEGIIRVKKIVQDLKDFSRVDSGDEWHRADLHKGLDSTLNVASNEIKYKANVKKEYGDIAEVECVISQLNQVFMNLLVNAAHAIEERGTITLRTGQQGDEVWVEVADTGKGIAPEHINKIFDPFFTTKPVGKGTGLGLSLSYGIIQKHHGRIEVNSEVGKGTSFKVWLPVDQPQDGDTPVDTAVGRVSAA